MGVSPTVVPLCVVHNAKNPERVERLSALAGMATKWRHANKKNLPIDGRSGTGATSSYAPDR